MSQSHAIHHSRPKAERLEARISPEQKKLLLQAADIQGRSLTDFIISSAQEAASKVLREHDVITLSAKDRDVFVRALLKPPSPGKALQDAARRYRKIIGH